MWLSVAVVIVACTEGMHRIFQRHSHIYHQTQHDLKRRGIDVGDVSLNLLVMLKAKEDAVTGLTKGIETLLKQNKVDYIKGVAFRVKLNDGGETEVEAKNINIATGSEVAPFPGGGIEIDEEQIVSSTGALSLKEVLEKLIVIGGGVIGLELGSFLGSIGGAGIDDEIAYVLAPIFPIACSGLKFKLNTKVVSAEKKDGKLESNVVHVSVGRRPYTQGLNLDNKGRIVIDDQFNTSVKGVKCIGDVTFGPMLTHKAEEEGIAAVEYVFKGHGHINYHAIPAIVYTNPEVAWVGKTEQELKAEGVKYKVGKFPFAANSRAKTNLDSEGTVKFLTEAETDRVLGEAVLTVEYGASAEDIARTCHAHPTLSEAFKEAAMSAYDKPIHFV
ncbi:hypothetical protein C8Q74DRAFT_1391797 [Fomes fomentarius]|nr:hypothetical protein C8Q74DRAFT_1391797 [Fomes fomentarius]